MGWPLLDNSPRTCTTTPSLNVACASTCLIFVWHSLNCSDITFLWISYNEENIWINLTLILVYLSNNNIWLQHTFKAIKTLSSGQFYESTALCQETYRLPINRFCQLPTWIKSPMNIGRVPPIKPTSNNIRVKRGNFRTKKLRMCKIVIQYFTCAGNLVPCLTVCNTASQTPALQAGDLASPSPFLW